MARPRLGGLPHRPFFHVVSFLDPHDHYYFDPEKPEPDFRRPWQNTGAAARALPPIPTGRQVEWGEERWGAYHRFYAERIERVDAELGRLLEELRCSGFANNTWVIFCSDHGDMAGEHDLHFKGPYCYEGVMRVPLVVVPPQRRFVGQDRTGIFDHDLQPSRQHGLCSLLDVPATILDLAGIERQPTWEGRSLLPWVRGETRGDIHEVVRCAWGTPSVRAVRTARHKLVSYEDGARELFDLEVDPGETQNLAGQPGCRELEETLLARLESR